MYFDPLYIAAMVLGGALCAWASWRVKSNFNKYSKVGVRSGMTGAQAAMAVARAGGATDVSIERHQGFLSDHYDPRVKTLRLSPEVYDGQSISSIAVAAHEAGHAIQHAQAYAPLGLRSALVPVVTIGNRMWVLPFIGGLILMGGSPFLGETLMKVGVGLFSMVVLFQLVTLPVEFDASRRAKAVLAETGIVQTDEEARGVSKVLGAAALTYVAAALSSMMTLAVLLLRVSRR
ncbi:MAG: Zn-dependent membrane protease YugP [Planctomycetota bacterium]|jgi:Zn-dependent membrane protease YugP